MLDQGQEPNLTLNQAPKIESCITVWGNQPFTFVEMKRQHHTDDHFIVAIKITCSFNKL